MSKLFQIFKKGSKLRVLLGALVFVLGLSTMGGAAGILANTFAKKSSANQTAISQTADIGNADVFDANQDDGKLHAANYTVTYCQYLNNVASTEGGAASINGNIFAATNKTLSASGSMTLIASPKPGYEFAGWYDGNNEQLTDYAIGDIDVESNMTVKAVFVSNTYTITLNANGGTVSDSSGSVTYGQTYNSFYVSVVKVNGLGARTPTRTGYTFNGWSLLPTTYQQVTYIESDGSAAIDTGIKPSTDTRTIIQMQFNDLTGQQRMFGVSAGDGVTNQLSYEAYINGTAATGGSYAFSYQNGSGNWISTGIVASTSHKIVLDLNPSGGEYNGALSLYTSSDSSAAASKIMTFAEQSSKTASYNVYLLARNYAGSVNHGGNAKFYGCQIYDGSTIQRNFVPCYRKSDGVIGAYDTVNNVFYTAKSGTFTKGSNIGYITDSSKVGTPHAHTLYANWTANRYAITLAGGSGSFGITYSDSSTVASSTSNKTVYAQYDSTTLYKASTGTVTVSAITSTRTGYTHKGYYTASTGGTQMINASTAGALKSAFKGTAAATYTAQWTKLWYADYTHTIDDANHTITITQYNGSDTVINVPGLTNIGGTNYQTVTNVTTGNGLYYGKTTITSVTFGSDGNNVTAPGCYRMFYYCTGLTSVNVTKLDASTCTTMEDMFRSCKKLTTITGLNYFRSDALTDTLHMFESCSSLTNLTFGSNFTTEKVTSMSYMFSGCSALTTITGLNYFKSNALTNTSYMFYNCSKLTSLTFGSNFTTEKVTTMTYMFYGCTSLTTITGLDYFKSNALRIAEAMFYSCSSLTNLTFGSNFTTEKVTSMSSMFGGCTALETITGLNRFKSDALTNTSYMFDSCSSLTSLAFGSNFTTEKVTDMSGMFDDCTALETITGLNYFNSNELTNTKQMFSDCSKLTGLTFGSNFTTEKVTDMRNMFYGCTKLATITGLNRFKSDALTKASYMFYNCSSITGLTFGSNFTTEKVTNMVSMFLNCSSLTTLNIGSFNLGKVGSRTSCTMTDFLTGCTALKRIVCPSAYTQTAVNIGDGSVTYYDITNSANTYTQLSSSNAGKTIALRYAITYENLSPMTNAIWSTTSVGSTTISGVTITNSNNTDTANNPYVVYSQEINFNGTQSANLTFADIPVTVEQGASYKVLIKKVSGSFTTGGTGEPQFVIDLYKGTVGSGSNPTDGRKFKYFTATELSGLANNGYILHSSPFTISANDASEITHVRFWVWKNTSSGNNGYFVFSNFKINIQLVKVSDANKTQTYASATQKPANPTFDGYKFNGWWTAPTGGTQIVNASGTVINSVSGYTDASGNWIKASNVTLYTHWTANRLYVQYNNNGGTYVKGNDVGWTGSGSVIGKTDTMIYGAYYPYGLTNPGNSRLTKTGYNPTTTDVYSNSAGTGTSVKTDGVWYATDVASSLGTAEIKTTSGGTFASGNVLNALKTGDVWVQVYVKWTPKTYTVTFNSNLTYNSYPSSPAATLGMASKTVTYGSSYGDLATAIRPGYIFGGWYTAASGGTQVTSSTTVSITAAQTLYARWTRDTYTATMDMNGGDSQSNKTFNISTAATSLTGTRSGYTLTGFEEKYTFTASNFASGFINISTGALEDAATAGYSSSIYSTNFLYLRYGTTYTFTSASSNWRIRYYGTNGAYGGNVNATSTAFSWTPGANMYAVLLFYNGLTDAQKAGVTVTSTITTNNIPVGSVGNRTYKALWVETTVYPNGYPNQLYKANVDTSAGTILLKDYVGTDAALQINTRFINAVDGSVYDNYKISYRWTSNTDRTYYTKKAVITSYTVTGAVKFTGSFQALLYSTDNLATVTFSTTIDTSGITHMGSLFDSSAKLTTINNLQYLDTSNVTTMWWMFSNCTSLTAIDVSGWNTSNAVNMAGMFYNCNKVTTLDVSSFNTEKVTSMRGMFGQMETLTTLTGGIGNFTSSNGTVTEINRMFFRCFALTTALNFSSNFKTNNVTNMQGVFDGCYEVPTIDVSNWNTAKVTRMDQLFRYCRKVTALDVSGFNTANVELMQGMFEQCYLVPTIDVSGFNTAKVTNMGYMFCHCRAVKVLDVSGFVTTGVTDMQQMFANCYALTSLNVSSFDTANVENFNIMFGGCRSLSSLDLSGFNTAKVKDMRSMFINCYALQSLDISNFVTSAITNSQYADMFTNCQTLYTIDVPKTNSISGIALPGNFYDSPSGTSAMTTLPTTTGTSKTIIRRAVLTFDANGGSVGTTSVVYTSGTTVTNLPTPTRSGYTFKGWYAEFNGTSDYLPYGRANMYTDALSVHVDAYMDNWDNFRSGGMRFISCMDAGGWGIENNTDCIYLQMRDASTGAWVGRKSSVTWASLSSGWHSFDIIYNGSSGTLYLDGTAIVTTGAVSPIAYHAYNGIIAGAEPNNFSTTAASNYFNGYIGNISIQNNTTVLTGTANQFKTFTIPLNNVTLKAHWEQNYTITYENLTPTTNTVWNSTANSLTQYGVTCTPSNNGTSTNNPYVIRTKEILFNGTQTGNVVYADVPVSVVSGGKYKILIKKISGSFTTGGTGDPMFVMDFKNGTAQPTDGRKSLGFTSTQLSGLSNFGYILHSGTLTMTANDANEIDTARLWIWLNNNDGNNGYFIFNNFKIQLRIVRVEDTNVSQIANDPMLTTSIPTYEGYKFNGWWTAPEGGAQVINPSGDVLANVSGWTDANKNYIKTSNATLYPHWMANILYVQINNNGGTYVEGNDAGWTGTGNVIGKTDVIWYGICVPSGLTNPVNSRLTRVGYNPTSAYVYTNSACTGNSLKTDGVMYATDMATALGTAEIKTTSGGTFASGNVLNALKTGDVWVQVYVKWTPISYTATVVETLNNTKSTNGGSAMFDTTILTASNQNKTVVYDNSYALVASPKPGYTFSGWYVQTSDAVASATLLTTDTNYTLNYTYTANRYFFAKFTANSYTAMYDANGGEVGTASGSQTFASNYSSLPTPTRTGYTFNGWTLLPEDYQQVEYIITNGTPYIDTGLKAKANSKVTAIFKYTSTNWRQRIFGSDSTTALWYEAYLNDTSNFGFIYGDNNQGWTSTSVAVSTTNIYTIDLDGYNGAYSLYLDANGASALKSLAGRTATQSDGNIYLMARRRNDGVKDYGSSGYFYGATMYEGATIKRNFVPCYRKADNVVGLFDTVNNEFYTTPTGAFTYGGSAIGYITSSSAVATPHAHTLYANWTPISYTATVVETLNNTKSTNGGSAMFDTTILTASNQNKTVVHDNSYALVASPKPGYTFSGWYVHTSDAVASATLLTTDTNYTLNYTYTANQYFFAKFTANSYTATYDANGGEVGTASGSQTFASNYSSLPTPTRTGYTFNGWTLLPEDYQQVEYIISTGSQYIDTGYNPNANTGVYATVQYTSSAVSKSIAGVSRSSAITFAMYNNGAGQFAYAYANGNTGWTSTGVTMSTSNQYSLQLDGYGKTMVVYTGSIASKVLSIANKTMTNSNTYPLILFAQDYNGTNNQYASMNFYGATMYEGATIKRNFVPCYRKADNVVGLFDTVNNEFYTTPTGAFTYGGSAIGYITSEGAVATPHAHTLYANWTKMWYADYTHTIDDVNHTITITRYNGSDTVINVPGLTNIGGTNYQTVTNVTSGTGLSGLYKDNTTITSVTFGSDGNNVTASGCYRMFSGCTGLTSVDVTHLDTSTCTIMASMFYGCKSLTTITGFESLRSDVLENMNLMFQNCSSLTNITFGENFTAENVTAMSYMFYNCSSLTNITFSENFTTENVTTMASMFRNCLALTSFTSSSGINTLSYLRSDALTTASSMFENCSSLANISFGENFTIQKVTSIYGMFKGCTSLVELDISSFNLGSTEWEEDEETKTRTSCKTTVIFTDCSSLKKIYCPSIWNDSVATPQNIYDGSVTYYEITNSANTYTQLSSSNAGKTIVVGYTITYTLNDGTHEGDYDDVYLWGTGTANIGYATKTGYTPAVACNLANSSITGGLTSNGTVTVPADTATGFTITWTWTVARYALTLNPNGGSVGVTFSDSTSIASSTSNAVVYVEYNSTTLYKAETGDVTVTAITSSYAGRIHNGYFTAASEGTQVIGVTPAAVLLAAFTGTENVTYYAQWTKLWYADYTHTIDDVNHTITIIRYNGSDTVITVPGATDIGGTAYTTVTNVTSGTGLYQGKSSITSVTFECTNINSTDYFISASGCYNMFYGCTGLISVDLTYFLTWTCTTTSGMFYGCSGLTSLDLSYFDTEAVTNMSNMFYGCSGLTSLDLCSFATSTVTDMSGMFYDCTALETLSLSYFEISSSCQTSSMLSGCSSLKRIDTSLSIDESQSITIGDGSVSYYDDTGADATGYTQLSSSNAGKTIALRYAITYTLNGGTHTGTYDAYYYYGKGSAAIGYATRTGYSVNTVTSSVGSVTNGKTSNGTVTVPADTTSGFTVTWTWTAKRYALTLNPNGGSVGVTFSDSTSIASSTSNAVVYAEYNSTTLYQASTGTVTVSTITSTRTGYTHNGYYTAASDGTQMINASTAGALKSAFKGTAAATYYAQWTANRYALTLNPNGGSVGVTFSDSSTIASSTSNAVVYVEYNSTTLYKAETGDATVTAITSSYAGRIHNGYFTAASEGTQVIGVTPAAVLLAAFTGTENVTYYAQWTVNGKIVITSTYTDAESIAIGFVKITDSSDNVWKFMLSRGQTYEILGASNGTYTATTYASINHEAKISGSTSYDIVVDGDTVNVVVTITPKASLDGGFYSSNATIPAENENNSQMEDRVVIENNSQNTTEKQAKNIEIISQFGDEKTNENILNIKQIDIKNETESYNQNKNEISCENETIADYTNVLVVKFANTTCISKDERIFDMKDLFLNKKCFKFVS